MVLTNGPEMYAYASNGVAPNVNDGAGCAGVALSFGAENRDC